MRPAAVASALLGPSFNRIFCKNVRRFFLEEQNVAYEVIRMLLMEKGKCYASYEQGIHWQKARKQQQILQSISLAKMPTHYTINEVLEACDLMLILCQ